MNKLFLLVKVQFLGLFGLNRFRHSKDKKERQKGGMLFGGALILGLALCFLSFVYSYALSIALKPARMLDLLPALMMAAVSLLILFTTLYKANGVLFGAKDFDLLMSLPVPSGMVVASRVLVLYLMDLLFAFVLLAPMAVVYALEAAPNWPFYLNFAVSFFFVPLIPLVISSLLGALVAKISSRFRRSNFLTILLTMAVCVGVIILSMGGSNSDFAGIGASIIKEVSRFYPPASWYISAVCYGDFAALAGFAAVSAAVFFLFCAALGRWFQQIQSALSARHAAGNFKMKALRQSTPFQALYRKELRRYFSSAIYVTNTAIGLVLALVLAVAMLFFKPAQLEQLLEMPGFSSIASTMIPLLISLMAAMCPTTGAAVSLEGKSLWILKSAPVPPRTVFASKIAVSLTLTLPTVAICGVLLTIALKPQPLEALFLFLTPAAFSLFAALLGLALNLHFPNFTWTSETAVVKQSAPIMLSMLGSMVLTILPIGISLAQPGASTTALLAATAAALLLAALLAAYLNTRGKRLFEGLTG